MLREIRIANSNGKSYFTLEMGGLLLSWESVTGPRSLWACRLWRPVDTRDSTSVVNSKELIAQICKLMQLQDVQSENKEKQQNSKAQ